MSDEMWARRLTELGLAVRARVIAARDGGADMASAVGHEGGDTIFAIDRHVEPVLREVVESWPPPPPPEGSSKAPLGGARGSEAVLLIAEGMGETGRVWIGPPEARTRHRLLVDPIDGTRGLMYDKRSAWFLAAVAPDSGEGTRLADAVAAVMVELPTRKQGWADRFAATAGGELVGVRERIGGGEARALEARPSEAETLRNGFAQVSNFFPGTKVLAAELMERIAAETVGMVEAGVGAVFDDQYMSTGGQMVELMMGRDRFCCDLRPVFHWIQERSRGTIPGFGVPHPGLSLSTGSVGAGLECHPYDAAGALVARRAGVILTDGFGRELDAPMDVHSGVHWCGYANEGLRRKIGPVIRRWLSEKGVSDASGA